jgi:hypothetical protein
MSRGLTTSSLISTLLSTSQLSDHEFDLMRGKFRQLEDELSKMTEKSTRAPVNTLEPHISTSGTAATFTINQKSSSFGEAKIIRYIMYKTRLFGQSHWMNGAVQVGF